MRGCYCSEVCPNAVISLLRDTSLVDEYKITYASVLLESLVTFTNWLIYSSGISTRLGDFIPISLGKVDIGLYLYVYVCVLYCYRWSEKDYVILTKITKKNTMFIICKQWLLKCNRKSKIVVLYQNTSDVTYQQGIFRHHIGAILLFDLWWTSKYFCQLCNITACEKNNIKQYIKSVFIFIFIFHVTLGVSIYLRPMWQL